MVWTLRKKASRMSTVAAGSTSVGTVDDTGMEVDDEIGKRQ